MKVFHANQRLRKMAQLTQNADKILDLGCSDMPNPYLTNTEVIGLDLRKGEVPPNYQDMKTGNVFDLPSPFKPDYFDAVVTGELIEHVENPVEFLRRCHSVIKPGGPIILSTPNPNSPMERLLTITLNRRYFYTPHHVMLYPQRWLIRIMEIAGFKSVKLYSGGIPFPFLGLVPFPRPYCFQTIATGIK